MWGQSRRRDGRHWGRWHCHLLQGKGNAWRTFNLICNMLRADRGYLRKIWDAMHIHWNSQLLTSRGEFPDYLGRDKN